MKKENINQSWEFRRGFVDSLGALDGIPMTIVDLPHDGMISTDTTPDAPAKYDSGYFNGDMCNYTKYIFIPEEWKNESIGLKFDGAMMHTTVEINGYKVGDHHYGYSPFYIDITDVVEFGAENRVNINANTGVQVSSRWYTGSGLYRGITLCHGPKVHIKNDGIYAYTKEVSDGVAYIEAQVDVCNETAQNRIVSVNLQLIDEKDNTVAADITANIQVNAMAEETAKFAFTVDNPKLWDIDNPNLYIAKATVTDIGTYRTRFFKNETCTVDKAEKLFGIRTITADAIRGLRINGKTVKLKGGCVHHDNGLLGAVSLYECEVRRIKKLKEIGFNAIRTAHNPPSEALVEACDREGLYIFDEAFDAWGIAKRPGDFSTHFESCWEKELTAFIRRDRIHPSVILWSTGNEIFERGGLNNGYTWATKLALAIKKLDGSRPVSNGICSLWSGLDDNLIQKQNSAQNAGNSEEISWDKITEPFTNGLDVVGYNYMEDLYENSHKLYPHRVMLGSENFPNEIGFRWPLVERLPYVIGEFTWTAWDYLGEAGIGKSVFVDKDDPMAQWKPWEVMPPQTSPYPWRLADDADIDITGRTCPQGTYRSVVWGSNKTHLYAKHPKNMDKIEMMSMWGFIDVLKNWNYEGYENKPVELVAFSNADEVSLVVNGKEIDRKPVSMERLLPNSVTFETVYVPGVVEAVSYKNGVEVSRDRLETTGAPVKIAVTAEKTEIKADIQSVTYINIDVLDADNKLVPDAAIGLKATVEGEGYLVGFGTGNPCTSENYTDDVTDTYKGHATLIVRSNGAAGKIKVTICAETLGRVENVEIDVK